MTVLASLATSMLQNQVLASLSASVQQRLVRCLQVFTMPAGMVLHESGDAMHHVYFPTDSIVALLYDGSDAPSTEILVAGNESVIGLEYLTGHKPPVQALVQQAGYALYVPVQILRDIVAPGDELFRLLQRHALRQHRQMLRSAACDRHHPAVLQRLCRWLLQSLKYQAGVELTITRHLLASLLGARRQCISDAAVKLERLGIITYAGSHITVLKPQRLERMCCECHVAKDCRENGKEARLSFSASYAQRARMRLIS